MILNHSENHLRSVEVLSSFLRRFIHPDSFHQVGTCSWCFGETFVVGCHGWSQGVGGGASSWGWMGRWDEVVTYDVEIDRNHRILNKNPCFSDISYESHPLRYMIYLKLYPCVYESTSLVSHPPKSNPTRLVFLKHIVMSIPFHSICHWDEHVEVPEAVATEAGWGSSWTVICQRFQEFCGGPMESFL